MKLSKTSQILAWLAFTLGVVLPCALQGQTPSAPDIAGLSRPVAGQMQLVFHGKAGPYRIQTRTSLEASAPWSDVPEAKVTEIQTGVFMALLPIIPQDDLGFYRVVGETEMIAELKGWTFLVQVSAPANKSYFVAGERPVITVTILDNFAQGITRDTFSTLNLYMHGPEDPKLTKTAVKLLNATTDRTKTPHHYIDLKRNAEVQVRGNVLTYTLQPVTDEAAGTYTVSVYAVRGDDLVQQLMKFSDVQIGTATVEVPVTTKASCTACHEGTMSGKMYMHHADVGRNPFGSWSLDYQPEKSCKACHNNDGYAAFADAGAPGGRRSDHIVIRAHGVHMGEGLKSDFNTNSTTGNFRDYLGVVFPANVKNCTACHGDDRWKTEPARLACGSCHDNTWFGARDQVPAGMVAHTGGAQLGDNSCKICHAPDGGDLAKSVSLAHAISPPAYKNVVSIEVSPPANGLYYGAGDKPVLTIKLTDRSGTPVDPATIVEPAISTNVQPTEWRNADLYVSGPRAFTVPVLTTAAALADPVVSRANNDLRVRKDPSKADPAVSRTADAILYQLSEVTNLLSGTYTAYVEFRPGTGQGGYASVNFQVGSTNIEPHITPASACISCHADSRIHASSRANTMTPDLCKSCHDYANQMVGKTNWTNSQWGFGISPLVRRVHGAHYGKYLHKGNENGGGGLSEIIFPQDVRNCTKCHSDTKSVTWNTNPSRLACLACHDSTTSTTHASLMTWDPTVADPWSGDEIETCDVCHGADSDMSAARVHSIANPYVPPYPREP
ncbi:MAG: hypothetical protein JNK85_28915 [Verrucomicrobiales bacterium]|nr:hypothetical protein [Verrucomicrobiales bacterium]